MAPQRNVSRLSAVRYFAAQLSPSATQSVYSSRLLGYIRTHTVAQIIPEFQHKLNSLYFVSLKFNIFTKMSESFFDQYEHYNFTEENKMLSGNSGRLRSKKVKFAFLCSSLLKIALCF